MQTIFWKEGMVKIITVSLLPLFPLSLIIAGIITSLKNNMFLILVGVGVILLLLCLCLIFQKDIFAKVIISAIGIELKSGKKCKHIGWHAVTDVKTIYSGYTLRYLTFISNENSIDIFLSKKLLTSIMELCSNDEVKNRIEALPEINSRFKFTK